MRWLPVIDDNGEEAWQRSDGIKLSSEEAIDAFERLEITLIRAGIEKANLEAIYQETDVPRRERHPWLNIMLILGIIAIAILLVLISRL